LNFGLAGRQPTDIPLAKRLFVLSVTIRDAESGGESVSDVCSACHGENGNSAAAALVERGNELFGDQ
jgi:cytochrome c553